MSVIKVGYLISYDFEFVKNSLPRVYPFIDEIYFAVDIEGKTWSGEEFSIPDSFWQWVKEFDTENKITIYKDQFYVPGLMPMECDTRERNMLGKKMGKADWYIQIDSDEYFIDFEGFLANLEKLDPNVPTTVLCRVATLFKAVPGGYLLINGETLEALSFATNNPVYDYARNNTSGNVSKFSEDLVVHQSWARTPEEIRLKLNNWSHKHDFNTDSLYNLWNAVDQYNYRSLSNFHPFVNNSWPKLMYIEGDIQKILDDLQDNGIEKLTEPYKVKKKPLLSRIWKEIKAK
ncbi:hypothetical protein [Pedobacter antarcticus]|uniref:hypothetical protein n=1 Tax=Pedobacter antarcticus TaxID=34086 RepID=UPI00292CC7FF|nr:hypothetical protein [Pedobacter antarcticus]